MPVSLGELEQLVLLALLRLGDEAYGIAVREELFRTARRELSFATIYSTLQRLAAKGLVKSRLGESTPERGGRGKLYFSLTAEGSRALKHSLAAIGRMTHGTAASWETR